MGGDVGRDPGFLARLESRLGAEVEHPLPPALAGVLTALSWVYHGLYLADRLPYILGWRRPVQAGVPCLGLGNLVVGGTGKTPCVIWLANRLHQAGRRPVVLSHGYKGRTAAPLVVSDGRLPVSPLPDGAGDEAKLAALSCPGVPVLAGRDRVAAARLAREMFDPGVILVDDAFQHWRLARDLDLVLLEAARPFGNGRLLPRGWLREPVEAVNRAGAIILVGAAANQAESWPSVPVFHAALAPVSLTPWEEWRQGIRRPIAQAAPERTAAFCGLAKPARFRATLEGLGWTVTDWLAAPDHDLPEPGVFRRWVSGGKEPVLTTEKDAAKLTAELAGLVAAAGRSLWVLGLEFRPREEEELLAFVEKEIQAAAAR